MKNLPRSSFQYMELKDHCVIATERIHQVNPEANAAMVVQRS